MPLKYFEVATNKYRASKNLFKYICFLTPCDDSGEAFKKVLSPLSKQLGLFDLDCTT
jgi:hypothetical protein